MSDINFARRFDVNGSVEYFIAGQAATGNKLLANIFEKTFLTNVRLNDVFGDISGGNAIDFVGRSFNPDDVGTVAALVAEAVDETVKSIQNDPASATRPASERLESADIIEIESTIENNIAVRIQVVPEERVQNSDLFFLF